MEKTEFWQNYGFFSKIVTCPYRRDIFFMICIWSIVSFVKTNKSLSVERRKLFAVWIKTINKTTQKIPALESGFAWRIIKHHFYYYYYYYYYPWNFKQIALINSKIVYFNRNTSSDKL